MKIVRFLSLLLWSMAVCNLPTCHAQENGVYGDLFKTDVKMKYVYSYDEALQLAAKQKKLIFFNCHADWALPCHYMDQYVFSNPDFCDYMNRTFVNLYMEMPTAEGKKLAEKYKVMRYAYYLILDANGEVVQRISGGGTLPDFKDKVDVALSEKTSLRGTRQKYESGKYSRKDFYNYLRALDIAGDPLFYSLAKDYMTPMKLSDYTRKENWLFVYPAIKEKQDEIFPYLLAHKKDFVKSAGEAQVNSMLEYVLFPNILRYATGGMPYNKEKIDSIAENLRLAALPDTCVTNVAFQVACLRGERNYRDLLQYLDEKGKYLLIYRTDIETSLQLPDLKPEEKQELVDYLRKAAEREKSNRNGEVISKFIERIEKGNEGIRFESLPFKELLAKAGKEKKGVFIDCYTIWCGPCKLMSNTVFTQAAVGEYFNSHFVCEKFDMEKGEGIELGKKYGVTAYPTLLFLDKEGNLLHKMVGACSAEELLKAAQKLNRQDSRAQLPFIIEGNTKNLIEGKKVYLIKPDISDTPVDSTVVKDGQFTFQGTVEQPMFAYLSAEGGGGVNFILEKGTVTVCLADGKLGGTPNNVKWNAYQEQIMALYRKMEGIRNKSQELTPADSAQLKSLKKDMYDAYNETGKISKEYILNNLDNVSPAMLIGRYAQLFTQDEVDSIIAKACPEIKSNRLFKQFVNQRDAHKNSQEGKTFTDFQMKDPEGKDVSLSDYVGKGKYVLVDFWASWCGPCRATMPKVKALYEKFKDKGLEIVGVSFDSNKEAWTKAIETMQLPWPQMSDLKGGPGSIASEIYGIKSIPYTLLIDPDGKIIGNNLQGKAIETELNKHLP